MVIFSHLSARDTVQKNTAQKHSQYAHKHSHIRKKKRKQHAIHSQQQQTLVTSGAQNTDRFTHRDHRMQIHCRTGSQRFIACLHLCVSECAFIAREYDATFAANDWVGGGGRWEAGGCFGSSHRAHAIDDAAVDRDR